jgi:hypothetical protein
MSEEDLIKKIRARVAQCRQLAGYITDEHARRVLNQMADDGEADLRKFETDQGEQDNQRQAG